MDVNEGIMYLAIGFMLIIGLWLTALTYLVFKRTTPIREKEDGPEDKGNEKEEPVLENDQGTEAEPEDGIEDPTAKENVENEVKSEE